MSISFEEAMVGHPSKKITNSFHKKAGKTAVKTDVTTEKPETSTASTSTTKAVKRKTDSTKEEPPKATSEHGEEHEEEPPKKKQKKVISESGKRKNPRNSNIDASVKEETRDAFIASLREAIGLKHTDYPAMRDIESVLLNNDLPRRAADGKNLYKFFSKGKPERVPNKDVFLAMTRALENKDMQPNRVKVSKLHSAAERKEVHDEVAKLLARKDAADSTPVTEGKKAGVPGLSRFMKPVVRPLAPSGPFFSHGLKWHMACIFYGELLRWGTEDSNENSETRLELRIEEEYADLLLKPAVVRGLSLNVVFNTTDLIVATRKMLNAYLSSG